MLKFRKDAFRGVNGIDSKKAVAKEMPSPYRWQPLTEMFNCSCTAECGAV